MEETNYHRELSPESQVKAYSGADPSAEIHSGDTKDPKKGDPEKDISNFSLTEARGFSKESRTSFSSRTKVFDRKALQYPNHLKGMMPRPLIFLTFPVIVYSGFSYGSNLIWFNVLNGTASLILSEPPYNFSSSIVGLAYFSPLIGVILG